MITIEDMVNRKKELFGRIVDCVSKQATQSDDTWYQNHYYIPPHERDNCPESGSLIMEYNVRYDFDKDNKKYAPTASFNISFFFTGPFLRIGIMNFDREPSLVSLISFDRQKKDKIYEALKKAGIEEYKTHEYSELDRVWVNNPMEIMARGKDMFIEWTIPVDGIWGDDWKARSIEDYIILNSRHMVMSIVRLITEYIEYRLEIGELESIAVDIEDN